MLDGLDFDPVAHRYRLDGRPILGVTGALQVISAASYAHVDPAVLAAKALLGQHVHAMIELDCAGELDVDALDPQLLPYFAAWRAFLRASGFVVVLSESKVLSRRYGFAGQLDLFGKLNAIPAVVDAKCVTTVMPSTGPQTAAYEQALRETRPDLLPAGAPCRRYALQLRPTGPDGKPMAVPWRLHPFTLAADLRLFLACLTVTQHLQGATR